MPVLVGGAGTLIGRTRSADPLQPACAAIDAGDSLAAAQQRLGRSLSPADAGVDAHHTLSQVVPACFCAVHVRADRVSSRRYACAEPTSPR